MLVCGSRYHPSLPFLFHTDERNAQGGQDVWGNVTSAPDDQEGASHTHGELISFRNVLHESHNDTTGVAKVTSNMTADEAGTWILEHTPTSFQVCVSCSIAHLPYADSPTSLKKMMATNYSFGIERDEKQLKQNDVDHTKWTNPLEHRYESVLSQFRLNFDQVCFSRLPNAPSMKFLCVYGHGKETERSYWSALSL